MTNELEKLCELCKSGECKLAFILCDGMSFNKVKFMKYLWDRCSWGNWMIIGDYEFTYDKIENMWYWSSLNAYFSNYPGIEQASVTDMFESFINYIENEGS